MTPVISFWKKDITKNWLQSNTTFAYPKTLIGPVEYEEALNLLKTHSEGSWVWKPNVGRQSRGVVLFERNVDGFRLFPTNTCINPDNIVEELKKIVKTRIFTARDISEHRRWFTEEWIHPHERLHLFTDDVRCPPIIRFCGRPKVHFVGMSPVFEKSTGLSGAG
jgi:hypothetical protein